MADRPGPVLVTGANSGFGLEATLRLAERGFRVHGTVRSAGKAAVLEDAAKERRVSGRVEALVLDVSDHAAVVSAFPELPDYYAVVNNAGYNETGPIEEVSAERARAQLDVNLIAPAVVASCALPGMRRRGEGRILMISSVLGRVAMLPLHGWYQASKFGLEALSDVLRVEVADFGVKVSIIEPGFFKTRIGEKTRHKATSAPESSLYADAYQRIDQSVEMVERVAPSPDVVARTIVSAIESRFPRKRYVVGVDAASAIASQPFVPRELMDLAMRLGSGLFGRPRKDDERR